jgi:drug/metabolite transporter (DMT)-like permease
LLAVRFTIAALLLHVWHHGVRRAPMERRRAVFRLVALGALGYAFESSLFFAALKQAPAGVVALVFYSYPIWTTILGLAAKLERFRGSLLAALLLGTAGVLLIFSAPVSGIVGPLLAVASALAVAVYLVVAQVFARGVEPGAAAAWTASGAACALVVASALIRQGLPRQALPEAAALGIATSIAFVMLCAAIRRIGSARAAVANMLEPVTTVILAAWLLDEVITRRIVAGAVLIVAALPILAFRGRRHVPPPWP